jgi:hypothetical protein
MQQLRALLMRHRVVALMAVLAALCMKIIVPAGYMADQESKILTVQLCEDAYGNQSIKQLVIPMEDEGSGPGAKHDSNGAGLCHFVSLSFASMSAAAPELLAIALAFILALGFALARVFLAKGLFHLRPPLRGPPALA